MAGEGTTEDALRVHTESLGPRCWLKVDEGRFRRQLDVTVHGPPSAIAELQERFEEIRSMTVPGGGGGA